MLRCEASGEDGKEKTGGEYEKRKRQRRSERRKRRAKQDESGVERDSGKGDESPQNRNDASLLSTGKSVKNRRDRSLDPERLSSKKTSVKVRRDQSVNGEAMENEETGVSNNVPKQKKSKRLYQFCSKTLDRALHKFTE